MGPRKPTGTAAIIAIVVGVLSMIGLVSCLSQERETIIPSIVSTPQSFTYTPSNIPASTISAVTSATLPGVHDRNTFQMLTPGAVPSTPALLITATTLPLAEEPAQDKGEDIMATPSAHSPLLQPQGILYVRVEYHQAQLGLSVVMGGGQFRPLTTVYEWWIDAQNFRRYRRATSELLEDGPHLVGADGADGAAGWWIVDWTRGITLPERHDGQPLFGLSSLDDFVAIFSRDGQPLIEAVQNKKEEIQIIGQAELPLWGTILSVQRNDQKTGQILTATVRAETPNILIESITTDRQGQLFETGRITNWEWLDPTQFDAGFWTNPPDDMPIGPGNLKP